MKKMNVFMAALLLLAGCSSKPASVPEKTEVPQATPTETAAPEPTVEATPEVTAEPTPEATPEPQAEADEKSDSDALLEDLNSAANDLKEAGGELAGSLTESAKEGLGGILGDSGSGLSIGAVLGTDDYQSIYDTYSQKLRDATPGLIDEYYSEAQTNTDGLEGLAEIANAKVEKLAEIANEGVSEMATYYYAHGSGKYSEYEDWAGKLYDVYMEEGQKVYDAYMGSVY